MMSPDFTRHVPDGVLPRQDLLLHRDTAVHSCRGVHSDGLRVDCYARERGVRDLQENLGVAIDAVQEGILHKAARGLLLAARPPGAVLWQRGVLRGPALLPGGRGAGGPGGRAAAGAVAALATASTRALARDEVQGPFVQGLGGEQRGASAAAVPGGPPDLGLGGAASRGSGIHEAARRRERAADDDCVAAPVDHQRASGAQLG
mmetsp:Transcript_83767/g.232164  ORF Transcript_83767/g.232164 Transcript_83767/m.232164 type:complete len:204 (-) Transcript_83767:24-635(-)